MSIGEKRAIPSIQTNFECNLVIETYYYSLLDVLTILRNQNNKVYNGSSNRINAYNLPNSGAQFETLRDTVAPELTFSIENLWSCVADVLKYIDAIPTLDENGYLGFEYLNDYAREPITLKKVDEKSSLSNEYYTNSLIANYQNAKQDNPITYPANNIFKRVAVKNYGVPTLDDYELRTDKPIDYLDHFFWVSDCLSIFL